MNGTGAGRVAAASVALVGWIGMAVQLDASIGMMGAVPAAIWKMLLFFTIIANLLAAIVMTGIALGRRGFGTPVLVGGVTIAMLLVGVVYALLLRGLLELSGGAALADLLLHSVTPVLVPLYWIAFAPKGGLAWRDPLVWAGLPIVYFGYALLRGAVEGVYPYPFMNVTRIGWGATLANALAMAIGFLVTGFLLVWLDRRLARTPG
jgi:hypothetical protein